MAGVRFFYTPRNKRFEYQPRYYDEQKEEMEKRIQRAKQELGLTDEKDGYVSNIKGQIRGTYRRKHKATRKSSGIRLLVILLILGALLYYIMYM